MGYRGTTWQWLTYYSGMRPAFTLCPLKFCLKLQRIFTLRTVNYGRINLVSTESDET